MSGLTLAYKTAKRVKALRKIDRPLEDHLQDIYELLREKEIALESVRQEVEALRLACPLLLDECDTPRTSGAGLEQEQESNVVVQRSDDRAASLALIHARLVAASSPRLTKESEKSVLLKFTQAALGASRTLLKRVRDSRLLQPEFQRKTAA